MSKRCEKYKSIKMIPGLISGRMSSHELHDHEDFSESEIITKRCLSLFNQLKIVTIAIRLLRFDEAL
jgi:hypothetical protein